jgi:hypothetical protein
MKKYIIYLSVLGGLFGGLTACNKEYSNPSSAREEVVVADLNGLYALCNGLPFRFSAGRASAVYSYLTADALTTKQWTVLNVGNTAEQDIFVGGGNIAPNNSVITRLFEQCNLVNANADLILNNIDKISGVNDKANLLAFASLYKNLSLIQMATFWEQAPIRKGINAPFSPRKDVLAAAITNLEAASAAIAAVPAPGFVYSAKLVGGVDVKNALLALTARAYLMLGNYDKANEVAAKVDLKVKTTFSYDAVTRNPIFENSFSTRNVTEPIDSTLGLPTGLVPANADKRVLFYLNTKKPVAGKNLGKGFYTANATAIPIYLPGEMLLIQAEALARKDDLTNALVALNKVITKKAADDAFGIGAELPAFASTDKAAILDEIYRNRCIELYNSGLKLEDSRRFGRKYGVERTRTFYPYPQNERDNNTSTPQDPTE